MCDSKNLLSGKLNIKSPLMSIKMIITAVILLSCIASSAQQKIELSTVKFTETPDAFLKDALTVHEGKLSGRDDMISYGIDNYSYKDKAIVIDFRTVTKEKFADGATGYLDIKTAAFADAYETLMKR